MDLLVLEKQQFEEIQKDIREIKDALISQGKMAILKKWLNTKSTAEFLNVRVRTIYLYCHDSVLHPKKVRGVLLFDRSEIELLIEGKNSADFSRWFILT